MIGSGSFGVVYKGTAEEREYITKRVGREMVTDEIINIVDVAIKVIDDLDITDVHKEVEYSYYMGEIGVGPKVYDTFFVDDKYFGGGKKYTQVIIMEYFDTNCYKALKSSLPQKDKLKIVMDMINLIKKQQNHGIYCYDIKPLNFVYRIKDKKVRMIDFGIDFCSNKLPKKSNIESILDLLVIQLAHTSPRDPDTQYIYEKNKRFKNRLKNIDRLFKELLLNKDINRTFHHYTWYGPDGSPYCNNDSEYVRKYGECIHHPLYFKKDDKHRLEYILKN